MKSLFRLLLIFLLIPISFAHGSEPKKTYTVSELIESKQLLDKATIQFQGEAIGQRLSITDFVWINVQDKEGNALGAFMPRKMSDSIKHFGTYKTQGDEVLLEGVYHSKCEEHGGDTDIHVQSLQIVNPGFPRKTDPVNSYLVIGCFVLGGFYLLFLFIKKRMTSESSGS